jgi:hypothetical protein
MRQRLGQEPRPVKAVEPALCMGRGEAGEGRPRVLETAESSLLLLIALILPQPTLLPKSRKQF